MNETDVCLRCGGQLKDFVDVCNRCANEAKQYGCSWEDMPPIKERISFSDLKVVKHSKGMN